MRAYRQPLPLGKLLVGRAGFEPAKAYASGVTVRPIWPLWYLPSVVKCWSLRSDSNRRPAVYKTAALPTELLRQRRSKYAITDGASYYTMRHRGCQRTRTGASRPWPMTGIRTPSLRPQTLSSMMMKRCWGAQKVGRHAPRTRRANRFWLERDGNTTR